MGEKDHALLSASSAKRWLACPPSVKLSEGIPPAPSSKYAEEGTLAHSLLEIHLQHQAGKLTKRKLNAEIKKLKENPLYEDVMEKHVEAMVDLILSVRDAMGPETILDTERRVDYSDYVPEGFGTTDCILVAPGKLEVFDLKYGKGVPVSAVENPQLRLYTLGAIKAFDFLYDIREVRTNIFQPRLDGLSYEVLTREEILDWADSYVRPRAEAALLGGGEFQPGDHCRFCPAKFNCRARAEENLALARHAFAPGFLLEEDELGEVLDKAEALCAWADDIKEYALQTILSGGSISGYKAVAGQSRRVYSSESALLSQLQQTFEGDKIETVAPRAPLPITKMEKVLPKEQFQQVVAPHITHTEPKPILAKSTDKRSDYLQAEAVFKKEEEK